MNGSVRFSVITAVLRIKRILFCGLACCLLGGALPAAGWEHPCRGQNMEWKPAKAGDVLPDVFFKRFSIEVYGGYAALNPADFNLLSDFTANYHHFFYAEQYAFFQRIFGSSYDLNTTSEGEFKKISHAFPFGFRVKFHLTPRLSVSLGARYLSARANSEVMDTYRVQALLPDAVDMVEDFTRELTFSPHELSVEGWAPMLGLHYSFPLSKRFSVEGFASVGIWSGSLDFDRTVIIGFTDSFGYWEERETRYAMDGEGKRVVGDFGLKLNFEVLNNMGVFLEGGYTLLSMKEPYGAGSVEYIYRDQNSEETYELQHAWNGYWGMEEETVERDWGVYHQLYPTNYWNESDLELKRFKLDLSGFQVRIGLFIRL